MNNEPGNCADTPQIPRWALVTGGAKRIGKTIVETLHRQGWNVFIHCHQSTTEAATLAASLNALRPDSATVISLDLGHKDMAETVKKHIAEFFGSNPGELGAVINNASVFARDPVTPNLADTAQLMTINCLQPYLLAKILSPLIGDAGAVVNLCDIHARRPLKHYGLYSISKAALEMATLSLAQELAPRIRVNGVSPGAILWPEQQDSVTAATKIDEVTAQIPLGRAGTPKDIAEAVLYLVNAPYVSGQIIAVDGGRSATGFIGAAT